MPPLKSVLVVVGGAVAVYMVAFIGTSSLLMLLGAIAQDANPVVKANVAPVDPIMMVISQGGTAGLVALMWWFLSQTQKRADRYEERQNVREGATIDAIHKVTTGLSENTRSLERISVAVDKLSDYVRDNKQRDKE